VKSEPVVFECPRGELEKLDLGFDGKPTASVIDLLLRKPCLAQQRFNCDSFLFCPVAGEPGNDAHRTRKIVEINAVGIAHG
jgi:hypothetical protein